MRQETVEIDGKSLIYTLRRSKRARNLLLHVDVDGAIELVVPWRASYKEGYRFIEDRRSWLGKQLKKQAQRYSQLPKRTLSHGSRLPAFGQELEVSIKIMTQRNRSTIKSDGALLRINMPSAGDIQVLIEGWYRKQAREVFSGWINEDADQVSLHSPSLRINGAKTQWGSCNAKKARISLNWRLALAPTHVARYVVRHEIAHLKYPNHSKRFWDMVDLLDPEYRRHRQWLRQKGHTLVL